MKGDGTRIVLVKPGDIVMLGNVTLPHDEDALETFNAALGTLRETLGLEHVCVFEDDIDLAVKPGEGGYHYHAHFGEATSAEFARAVRDAADGARIGRQR